MALMMSAEAGLSAFPDGDNIFQWTGTITGGAGTVREAARACACQRHPRPAATSHNGILVATAHAAWLC